MSPVFSFDIIALIIDIVGEDKDTNLLKKLALVSHIFLQICSKHIFATIDLYDANLTHHEASSKKGFVKLLKIRPDVVKHIRKLTYRIGNNNRYRFLPFQVLDNDDDLLSPILPNLLRTIPYLNCLSIAVGDWKTLDSSLSSALLHLMHLPTINHIDLSYVVNFPLSSLSSSVNLHRLHFWCSERLKSQVQNGEDDPIEIVQSEMMPKISEFRTFHSSLLTTKLLHAKMQDGRPAFNFMDLRRVSMSFAWAEDEPNIRYLLQNAKLLEKLHLSVGDFWSLVGLLSPIARILKVLDLSVFLHCSPAPPLAGLCQELEAMAGHNMLEALSFEVKIDGDMTEDFVGSTIQKMEDVLVKPGWSALREISFRVSIIQHNSPELYEALQSLPDKYLSHLSKLESVAFNYSASPTIYPV